MLVEFEIARPFFMTAVNQGLAAKKAPPLDGREATFLAAPLDRLKELEVPPSAAKGILARCSAALSEEYARKVTALDPDAYMVWRNHNTEAWKHSACMLDCIVQNWYITTGQRLEKKLRPGRSLYTWYSPAASLIWDEWFTASAACLAKKT
jgi:hypothetical protein